jgi:hypothetical protein
MDIISQMPQEAFVISVITGIVAFCAIIVYIYRASYADAREMERIKLELEGTREDQLELKTLLANEQKDRATDQQSLQRLFDKLEGQLRDLELLLKERDAEIQKLQENPTYSSEIS